MIEFQDVKFQWLGHDGFLITRNGSQVVIDPFRVEGNFSSADVIISTHQHGDHCSFDDISKFSSTETEIIGIPLARGTLEKIKCKKVHYVKPGDELQIKGIKFKMTPAYNVNKFRSPGVPFHPKEDKHIGVIITLGSTRIYHTGDSDHIPEMSQIKTDVALLPVSGTYVMTHEEAIEAAKVLSPKLAIPMHWGSGVVGDKSMAEKFAKGVKCPVKIPTK